MAKKNWIGKAIKHPGALRAKAKAAGKLGADGKISKSWLQEKAKGNDQTARQARMAIALSHMR